MRVTLLTLLLLSLTAACKKTVKVGGGGTTGARSAASEEVVVEEESVTEEDTSEVESGEDGPIEPSKAEETFSLVAFIKSRPEPELDEIKKKINPEVTKIVVGDQDKFSLESNMSMQVSPSTDETAPGERKIVGKFWVDAYMFNKKVKNIGEGAQGDQFMEAAGTAVLDKLNMEAYYRYLGVDVSTKTVTAGWEPRYTRDNEVKFGANAVIVGAEVSLRMGGEVAIKFEFGVRRDDVLNLVFTPQAHITAGIGGAIKILGGVGSAGPRGVTKMMDYIGRGNANLGYIKSTKMIYADIGVDPGSITFTDGKVDLVASSLGRTLWTKNVYDPKPLVVKKVPQYGTTVVKYTSAPDDCAAATAEAEKVLNAGKVKLTAYMEAVDELDKPVILSSLNRMDELKTKAKVACKN
jgi:hypothetical protein